MYLPTASTWEYNTLLDLPNDYPSQRTNPLAIKDSKAHTTITGPQTPHSAPGTIFLQYCTRGQQQTTVTRQCSKKLVMGDRCF